MVKFLYFKKRSENPLALYLITKVLIFFCGIYSIELTWRHLGDSGLWLCFVQWPSTPLISAYP